MPQTLKQKRQGALDRAVYRLTNPVPSGQDQRVKKNPRSEMQALKDADHLQTLIVRS